MYAISKLNYTYAIDPDDIIVSVCHNWLVFARENGASNLNENTVVGRPLFEFVYGDETKRLYRLVLARIRSTRRSVRIPFRCDGPTVRRFMELRISPHEIGGIEFIGRIVREEAREAVRLFDSSVDRTKSRISVCTWCKQVRVENGVWLEVEAAILKLGLFESLQLPGIIHGVCEPCEKQMVHLSTGVV